MDTPEHKIGMALHALHCAISQLHELHHRHPALIERDAKDILNAQEWLTELCLKVSRREAAE